MKINSNFRIFAGMHFDPTKYIESPAYGVSRFMLDRIGSEKARATTIVKYNPKSKFPEHTHIGGEEFMVLEGTFKDQFGEFPAGTYVRNPISSKHAPWVDEDGCTIMVKLLQMAETGEGTDPLHVNIEEAKKSQGIPTDYGTSLVMYQNPTTGENVQMCWLKPNQVFSVDENSTGGEELFVMDGSLVLESETYSKWGWLRFPPGELESKRVELKSGTDGAIVYRKTGHLTDSALAMEKIKIEE